MCCGRFFCEKMQHKKSYFVVEKTHKNYAPTCVGAKMHTWVPCSVRAKMHTCVDVYTLPREGVNVRRGVGICRYDAESAEILCFFGLPP